MADILDKQTIKALSADARQEIMKMLAKRPYTASEIAKITRKHVTTIGEHLAVLEDSGLVKKKESTNKWVYYTLTEKGEHLFKPQFYSWVVTLSISLVLLFTGFLRTFGYQTLETAEKAYDISGAPAQSIQPVVQPALAIDTLGMTLIILSIIGFVYTAYMFYSKRKMTLG